MTLIQILLQAPTVEKAQSSFLQYGVLGVFTILLLWAIIYYEKKRTARETEQSLRITELEKRFDEYQRTDRVRMEELLQENTHVMREVLRKLEK